MCNPVPRLRAWAFVRILRHLGVILGICGAASVQATTFNPDYGQLARDVDVVAEVEISSGELVSKKGDGNVVNCGARYTGRVLRALKGAQDGDLLEFGPYSGYSIGDRYVLFLVPHQKAETGATLGMTSSNSAIESRQAEWRRSCASAFAPWSIVGQGTGAVPVVWSSFWQGRQEVRYRALRDWPRDLVARCSARVIEEGEVKICLGETHVEVDEFLRWLKARLVRTP